MKALLLSLMVALIGSAGLLHAQGIDFGFKAGPNIASQKITGDYKMDTRAKIGFHGGVFFVWMFSEKIGLQPELLFSIQGSIATGITYDYRITTNYATIPVLARYNINDMFSVHAGPQLGILVRGEEEFDGDTHDIKKDFKSTDVGLALGAEADLPANVGVGLRYVIGLVNVVDESGSFGHTTIKNGVFQIYVNFRIVSHSDK